MVVILLSATLPAAADAAWYTYPSVVNQTSIGGPNCPSSAPGNSCISTSSGGLDDGEWIDTPWGAVATAAGTWNGHDQFSYENEYDLEGADGYFLYDMPDGVSQFQISAEDDRDGAGEFPIMYPGCAVPPTQFSATYACSATFSRGTLADPDPSDWNPYYNFTPAGQAPYIAAGQICTINDVVIGQAYSCEGQWSPTDPENFMFLTFYGFNSDNYEVTVADSATMDSAQSCSFSAPPSGGGTSCSLVTSGGQGEGGNGSSAPDPITITATSGQAGGTMQVMVAAQAELNWATAEGADYEMWQDILDNLTYDLQFDTAGGPYGGGDDDDAVAPGISSLQISPPKPARTIRYRATATNLTTVFTLARSAGGNRWDTLDGVRRLTTATQFGTRDGKRCNVSPRRGVAPGAKSCQKTLALRGHFVVRDGVKGTNVVRLRKRLRPGRYRLTAVARHHASRLRPLTKQFRVRPRD